MKKLSIAGHKFNSRLFLGSGKFASRQQFKEAIERSGSELVTVALTRVDFDNSNDDILSAIDQNKLKVMLNTSGARTAAEAVKIAEIGRAGGFEWIKLEIHPDPNYLLPDPVETLQAAEVLVAKGFVVLPYINADPVLAKRLQDVGCHTVMPLGAPIGSNQGLQTRKMLEIIIEQATVPVVIDAGIGTPSQAAEAIEMGADAVLVNSAIAAADEPSLMAEAFALAVKAAQMGREAGFAAVTGKGSASSPMNAFGELFK